MNPLIMMAMAMTMSNRSNAASTAQTVLGASDGLGQSGRLAVGLVRQRNDEQARYLETRETGQQLVELLREHKITTVDLTNYPALKKSIDAALPAGGTTSASAAHMHGAPAPTAAAAHGNVVSIAPGTALTVSHGVDIKRVEPHVPVDPKYALSVASGNVQGSVRVSAAADAAAAQARADADAAIAAAAVAQATAAKAAEDATTAVAAAKPAPGDQALADKATAAKKKADEAAAAAVEAEAKAHAARATAHTASHAAKELREMLSRWC